MPNATDAEFKLAVGVGRDSIRAFCTFCELSYKADLNWRGNVLTLEGIADAKALCSYIESNFGDLDNKEAEVFGYAQMTCAQLRDRLGDLGLTKSGAKAVLVARLVEADNVDRELAAAPVDVGDDDEQEALAAIDDAEDEVVERIDWSNMSDDELRRMCELWRVKGVAMGRFTRSRAIGRLEALHERGEGCVCAELAAGDACCCGWVASDAAATDGTEDVAEVEVEVEAEGETAPVDEAEEEAEQMSAGPMPTRKRNSRWFTLETAESHMINYKYLVDLWDYAIDNKWDISLIQMIDQSTLEIERYFGRVKAGSQGTPSMQQFMQADRKVRLDYYIGRLKLRARWLQGSKSRGNVGGTVSGADPTGQAGDAVLGTLMRRSKLGRSRGKVAAAVSVTVEDPMAVEKEHAAAVRHELKHDGLKQSLASTANKSNYNSGGACRVQMLPPGPYVMLRDLGAPTLDALNGQRCAVYWKDKPQARTEAQRKAGEKGRWWTATVTGVERVRNTLLLAVMYDAQHDVVEGTEDKLDVRQEHVVWVKE